MLALASHLHQPSPMDKGWHLIILDDQWRPCRAEPIVADWRTPFARLVALECRWIVLHQSRRPSRNIDPGHNDIMLTRTLVRWLRPFDIRMADHIIRAGDARFSFRAAGLL